MEKRAPRDILESLELAVKMERLGKRVWLVCADKRVLLVTEATKVNLDLRDLLDFQEKMDLRVWQGSTAFKEKQGSQGIPAYLVSLG